MVGLGRLELPTSRLSGVRSNHLSYKPVAVDKILEKHLVRNRYMDGHLHKTCLQVSPFSLKGGDPAAPSDTATLLRLYPSH